MTRDEVKKILMVVQAAYPNFHPPDKTITVDIWHRFLKDYAYEQVNAAVGMYIRSDTSGFAPNIGDVVEKLQTLFEPEDLNEIAAWGMVLKAIRNSGYHAEEEFARLPPTVQKAVASPAQLREWALAEDVDGTWMNVTQSNFLRTYRVETAREKEMQKMTPEIRGMLDSRRNQPERIEGTEARLSATEERILAEKNRTPITPEIQNMLDNLKDRLKADWVCEKQRFE